MGKIRQHIPNFCSGLDSQEIEFNNLAELMAIPWVKQWTDDKNFFRFSISDEHRLMAETHSGRKWWVIGFLTDCQLNLPEWVKHETTTTAPVPRPTEIKDDRARMGQVKRDTIEDINRDIEFRAETNRKNLSPIIE